MNAGGATNRGQGKREARGLSKLLYQLSFPFPL